MWQIVVKLAQAWGPRVFALAGAAIKWFLANPQNQDVLKRLAEVLRVPTGGTPAQKLEARVRRVREVAEELAASEPVDDVLRSKAAEWVRRARDLTRALDATKPLKGADSRKALRDVRRRIDALAAEVFAAMLEQESGISLPATDVEDVDDEASPSTDAWTLDDLHTELDRWERELRAEGKSENTVNTYVGRSRMFLSWLDGGASV